MLVNYIGAKTKWGIVFGEASTKKITNRLNYVKFNYTNQPLEIFSKLHQKYKTTYLLESIEGPKKLAQYSFLGFDPKTTIEIKNGTTTITDNKTNQTTIKKTDDPFKIIQEHLEPYSNNAVDFRFVGGALGYISYDVIRYIENYPTRNQTT